MSDDVFSAPDVLSIPVTRFVPNEDNPQEMDEKTFNELVDGILQNGMIAPITVVSIDDGKYRIIGGEHRWRAAIAAGMTRINAQVVDQAEFDADAQDLLVVRLNALQGKMNPEKFRRMYERIAEKYGAEATQKMMGFVDQAAFKRLVGNVKDGIRRQLPRNMQKEFSERAKEAQTVDDLSSIIQHIFNSHGATVSRSYMVFSYGGTEHIYVQMTAQTRRAMHKVLDYTEFTGEDINEFMAGVIAACAATAEKKHARALERTTSSEERSEPDLDTGEVPF